MKCPLTDADLLQYSQQKRAPPRAPRSWPRRPRRPPSAQQAPREVCAQQRLFVGGAHAARARYRAVGGTSFAPFLAYLFMLRMYLYSNGEPVCIGEWTCL